MSITITKITEVNKDAYVFEVEYLSGWWVFKKFRKAKVCLDCKTGLFMDVESGKEVCDAITYAIEDEIHGIVGTVISLEDDGKRLNVKSIEST